MPSHVCVEGNTETGVCAVADPDSAVIMNTASMTTLKITLRMMFVPRCPYTLTLDIVREVDNCGAAPLGAFPHVGELDAVPERGGNILHEVAFLAVIHLAGRVDLGSTLVL